MERIDPFILRELAGDPSERAQPLPPLGEAQTKIAMRYLESECCLRRIRRGIRDGEIDENYDVTGFHRWLADTGPNVSLSPEGRNRLRDPSLSSSPGLARVLTLNLGEDYTDLEDYHQVEFMRHFLRGSLKSKRMALRYDVNGGDYQESQVWFENQDCEATRLGVYFDMRTTRLLLDLVLWSIEDALCIVSGFPLVEPSDILARRVLLGCNFGLYENPMHGLWDPIGEYGWMLSEAVLTGQIQSFSRQTDKGLESCVEPIPFLRWWCRPRLDPDGCGAFRSLPCLIVTATLQECGLWTEIVGDSAFQYLRDDWGYRTDTIPFKGNSNSKSTTLLSENLTPSTSNKDLNQNRNVAAGVSGRTLQSKKSVAEELGVTVWRDIAAVCTLDGLLMKSAHKSRAERFLSWNTLGLAKAKGPQRLLMELARTSADGIANPTTDAHRQVVYRTNRKLSKAVGLDGNPIWNEGGLRVRCQFLISWDSGEIKPTRFSR